MASKKQPLKTSKSTKAAKPAAAAATRKTTNKSGSAAKPPKQKTAASAGKARPKTAAGKTTAKSVARPATVTAKPEKPVPAEKIVPRTKKKLTEREERLFKIKLHLVRQRNALLSGAESALNELPGQTIFPDLGDQATAETDRNFMLRLRGREQRLLKKIDEAIERIDSGTFGICEDCGNEIDIKRLEVRPVTSMCIECKTLQEEEEKLRES